MPRIRWRQEAMPTTNEAAQHDEPEAAAAAIAALSSGIAVKLAFSAAGKLDKAGLLSLRRVELLTLQSPR